MGEELSECSKKNTMTAQLWNTNLLPGIIQAMDLAVMVELPDNAFMTLGCPPHWLNQLGRKTRNDRVYFDFPGSFMENFLIDSRVCWCNKIPSKIRSGQWIETDADENEQAFEATALTWNEQHILLIQVVSDEYEGLRSVVQQVRDVKRVNHKLERMAYVDELTGLYNRRGFNLFADKQWLQAMCTNQSLLLFCVDMDGLKTINDNAGHNAGDRAIVDVSEILRHVFRGSDILARLGGDEFAAMVMQSGWDCADRLIQRLQHATNIWNLKSTEKFPLSISIGVTAYDGGDTSLEKLLSQADEEMYKNKQKKRRS